MQFTSETAAAGVVHGHDRRHGHADRRRRHLHRQRGRRERVVQPADGSSSRPTRSTRCRRAATTSRSSRSRRTCCRSCRGRWPSRAGRPPPTARSGTASSSPARADAALFEIPAQAPESSQIDVLNVFNDSSQADGVGTMTSTTLTGFGMSKGLTFDGGTAFGEPATFPGGISFGTIGFVNGQFTTDGAKSTIEVLNVLLGQGNDKLTITGTLDPATEIVHADHLHRRRRHRATGAGDDWFTLTRRDGTNWAPGGANAASDFVVGQQVLISGVAGRLARRRRLRQRPHARARRGRPALAAATNVDEDRVSVPGPHGGLTVVHGGGNFELQLDANVDVAASSLDRARRPLLARRRLPGRPADLDRRLDDDVDDHRLRRRDVHARRPVRALRQGREDAAQRRDAHAGDERRAQRRRRRRRRRSRRPAR